MASKNSDIFQFKISLRIIKPLIWRRIQVPADFTFKKFHLAIQSAMGWSNRHLFDFRMKGAGKIKKTSKLSQVFLTEKTRAEYEYDFGDGWEHIVVLEKILPRMDGEQYPRCLDGKRACPPEDCGGYDGYEDHVKIVSNKSHPEYKDHMDWLKGLPGATDPEAFDPQAVKF